ncbi:MAG: hypothetical protein FJ190_12065 [Gammaproteobacteria bacterium]|nr:hypothetical protein [Gammaproteobacteria bacterium]
MFWAVAGRTQAAEGKLATSFFAAEIGLDPISAFAKNSGALVMFIRIYIRNIFVLLYLFSAFAFAETLNKYPDIKFTDAALNKAKEMLAKENDKRAGLTLFKGIMTSPEYRTGWMLQVVNKEQFPNDPRKILEA